MAVSFEDIRQLIADIFDVPSTSLTLESNPDTVDNWDSLRLLNLIVALEQEFGIEISTDHIPKMMSVQAIVDIVAAA